MRILQHTFSAIRKFSTTSHVFKSGHKRVLQTENWVRIHHSEVWFPETCFESQYLGQIPSRVNRPRYHKGQNSMSISFQLVMSKSNSSDGNVCRSLETWKKWTCRGKHGWNMCRRLSRCQESPNRRQWVTLLISFQTSGFQKKKLGRRLTNRPSPENQKEIRRRQLPKCVPIIP